MKFGMVVVLYNPAQNILQKIANYSSLCDEIIVVDNTPSIKQDISNFFSKSNFTYLINNNIGGIARAFNLGLDLLLEKGCDFLFTFDQDSQIPDNFFVLMKSFIQKNNADIVCPDYIDVNLNIKTTFVELSKWSYKKIQRPNDSGLINASFAISSGMGFSKQAWLELRYFNENMVIDHVDTDICLKAISKGYNIKVNLDICLPHAVGERSIKRLLVVTFKPNNHNYIRKYYIVRNGTYLGFVYFFKYPSYFYLNFLRVVHESVCVIFYEEDKLRKIKYILKGIWDAIFRRIKQI